MAENIQEISDVGAKAKKTVKVLNWTPPMSHFMMKCLAEIAAKGVKTDKGFKEIHLTQVAKSLSDFLGFQVTSIQVHNHLRKWRTRWQKITQLRGLSGALWNDEKKMIMLEEQHYLGHTQDHPRDAEFLNKVLENYAYMELCFADKLATGKFAMESSEPLGKPIDVEGQGKHIDVEGQGKPIDVEGQGTSSEGFVHGAAAFEFGILGLSATNDPSPTSSKKRKRTSFLNEEDSIQCNNMFDAVREIASAINNTCHTETHPDLYNAVMDLAEFELEERLAVLDYLTEHKGKGLNFVKMEDEVRRASFKRILLKNPDLI